MNEKNITQWRDFVKRENGRNDECFHSNTIQIISSLIVVCIIALRNCEHQHIATGKKHKISKQRKRKF